MVKHISSNTYKVETDGFRNAILEAAIAGASFRRTADNSTYSRKYH